MKTLEKSYHFVETIATIIRNYENSNSRFYYIFFYIKNYILKPKNLVSFEGTLVYFESYNSVLASITEVFFAKSCDFIADTKSPTIIDCGANNGITALFFKKKYPKAKITCVEPVPNTFKLLEKNLKPFSAITCLNYAIGNSNNPTTLFVPKVQDQDSLFVSTSKERWSKNTKFDKVSVKTIKLSSLIKEKVDCVILDIEGNEEKILKDLENTKKIKLIKNIFVEFHGFKGNSLAIIASILERNDFKIVYGCGVRSPYHKYVNKFHALPLYAKRMG